MAEKVHPGLPIQNTSSGIKVEGDLGGLRIEELSESDEERTISISDISSKSVSHNIPNGLLQSSATPVFGSVAVTNSDNVQFGNNTFFNGPVTIKQVVQNKSGIDNASYARCEDEHYDGSSVKFNRTYPKPVKRYYQKLQKWHILIVIIICAIIVGCACVMLLNNSNESPDIITEDGISKDFNIQLVDGSCDFNTKLTMIYLILIILIPLTSMAYITFKKVWDTSSNIVPRTEEELLIAADHLRIVSREDWLAQPVDKPLDPIRQPIPWVIISHTAGYGCSIQSECVKRVRLIQMFHVESNHWFDIGYNFLVGGDGSVYWGRGWDNMGAHTKGYNKYSIGVAFIGTFKNNPPPKQQVDACQKLINLGVKLGKLKPDYKIFAHRQLMSTVSPGDKIFELMQDWPHFVKNVSDIQSLVPSDYR